MCGRVKQHRADIRPLGTLTVQYADGTYRQHIWGLPVRGSLIYNARREELDLTWGKLPPRVSVELDGYYERDKAGEYVYFPGPFIVKGIVVSGRVLLVTTDAKGRFATVHPRMLQDSYSLV